MYNYTSVLLKGGWNMIVRYMEINDPRNFKLMARINSQEDFRNLALNFGQWFMDIGGGILSEACIASKAEFLIEILTRNNTYGFKLAAFLSTLPSTQELEQLSQAQMLLLQCTIKQLCLISIDACSEIAAADEVYIANYEGTGKRHKLKKFASDSDT